MDVCHEDTLKITVPVRAGLWLCKVSSRSSLRGYSAFALRGLGGLQRLLEATSGGLFTR